jgi:DeoR family transcriptional regulator of aga operon
MLPNERRETILRILHGDGSGRVTDLADQLEVSKATIRNDLSLLQSEGLLTRVHGGATLAEHPGQYLPFETRRSANVELKKRIGKAASALVEDGDTIIVDSGTTTAELVPHLLSHHDLTVVTNGLPIAMLLARAEHARIVLTGGLLNPETLSLQGPAAEATFSEYYANKLFLGLQGIDLERGLTDTNIYTAKLKQAMIGASKRVILLADSTKFGSITFVPVAPLSCLHQIVVDDGIPGEMVRGLKARGIEVLLA